MTHYYNQHLPFIVIFVINNDTASYCKSVHFYLFLLHHQIWLVSGSIHDNDNKETYDLVVVLLSIPSVKTLVAHIAMLSI